MLSREAFLDTEAGQVIGEFFTIGDGRFIDGWLDAEGFSLVSEDFVLFYRNGLPAWDWHIDDGDRVGGGGCLPEWTLGELTVADWSLTAPIDENDRLIIIEVRVASCSSEAQSELAGVELIETTETIEITAWVRPWGEERACIGGFAVGHPAVVVLRSPLGGRTVLDAGVIPGQEITFGEE
jgi:hypothetical protein